MINRTLNSLFLVFWMLPSSGYAGNSAPWIGTDLNNAPCQSGAGSLSSGHRYYGPFDYTNANERSKFLVVEEYHFKPEVENLVSGSTGKYQQGDMFYVLNAVPNHHRALLTLIRYQLNLNKKLSNKNTNQPLRTPVECVFQRAIHFSPNDAATISLLAYYLKEIGQLEKAADLYEKALILSPDNAKIEYAYSLLLIDQKNYDKAVIHAKKAYKIGQPPQALKLKLQKLGKW